MPSIISFHVLHDANVSIVCDGELKVVLELERLFEQRYFCSNPRKNVFVDQWKEAINYVMTYSGCSEFDIGITSWVMPSQVAILKTLVNAKKWVTVDHHLAHAALGFYDSAFHKSLVFSYDGGGNDGTFIVYFADREINCLKQLKWVGLNLGTPFRQLAIAMPELTGSKDNNEESKDLTTYMRFAALALSGKVMGYAALGKVQQQWIPAFEEYYYQFVTPLQAMYTLGEKIGFVLEPNSLEDEDARNIAATSQHVFESLLCKQVEKFLNEVSEEGLRYKDLIDGIILTGGCALNVHANQLIFERFGLPVHVPSAPNDCGISVGAVWVIDPPKTIPRQIQYSGLPLFDLNYLQATAMKRNARKVGVEEVARILVEEGVAIGVVRGRQEFGPRALGHRSVLCYPNKSSVKDEINRFKSREWFRPLCPSVTAECASRLFERVDCQERAKSSLPQSPYMSFAPKMTEDGKRLFPAICHHDGTSRLQTVTKEDEPWYHSLLCEVGKLNGGYEVLLNTSFNVKGKSILNRLNTALQILDTSKCGIFKYVLIEDWLFCQKNESKTCS